MRLLSRAATVLAVCLTLHPARSAGRGVINWTGLSPTAPTNWFDPRNWSTDSLPDANTGALIGAGPQYGPIITGNAIAASVGIGQNELALQSGSLQTGILTNNGSFNMDGASVLRAQTVSNTVIGSLDLGGVVTTQSIDNSGFMGLGGNVSTSSFSNSGTWNQAGILNLLPTTTISNTGTLNLIGGTINGGVLSLKAGPSGMYAYGTLNLNSLDVSGMVWASGGTLVVSVQDTGNIYGQLGALAAGVGNGTNTVSIAGSAPLINQGFIYSAHVSGSTNGVLELVGNAAGTPVLINQPGFGPMQGVVDVGGALVVRNPDFLGNVYVENNGTFTLGSTSQVTMAPGANLVLTGTGELYLAGANFQPAAGTGLTLDGQSINGAGTVAFHPASPLGNIGADGVNGPKLTVIPDAPLTATGNVSAGGGATLVLDLHSAGSFTNAGWMGVADIYNGGTVMVQGADTLVNQFGATISIGAGQMVLKSASGAFELANDGTLLVESGAELRLSGGQYTIDGMGDVELQGTIRGETGTESLTIAQWTGIESDSAMIANLASFENQGWMETYSGLSIDAGAVVNSGEIGIGVGTVTVTTPLMTNSGSIGISGGSLLTVNGNVLDTGNLEIDLGSSANISDTLTQTAGDVQVDGALSASRMVCEGGTLGGSGSITANVEVGCLMSPGDSPGRMDIFGNFILDAAVS